MYRLCLCVSRCLGPKFIKGIPGDKASDLLMRVLLAFALLYTVSRISFFWAKKAVLFILVWPKIKVEGVKMLFKSCLIQGTITAPTVGHQRDDNRILSTYLSLSATTSSLRRKPRANRLWSFSASLGWPWLLAWVLVSRYYSSLSCKLFWPF